MTQVRTETTDARDTRSRPGSGWAAPPPIARRTWLAIGGLVALAAVAVVVTAARPTPTTTVHGFVTIYGLSGFERPGADCGQPLFAGRPVTVFDGDGNALGTTALAAHGTATDRWHTFAGGYADACRYEITVPDVATASSQYTVAVGTESGDGVGFTRDQLGASIDVPYGHA